MKISELILSYVFPEDMIVEGNHMNTEILKDVFWIGFFNATTVR
jgi:hypothetical protein